VGRILRSALLSERLLDAFPVAADEAYMIRRNVVAGITRFDEFGGNAIDILIDIGQLAFQRAGIFIRRLRRLARMALLAAGLAFRYGEHFNIDFITNRMGFRSRTLLGLWMSVIAGLFLFCIILWGIPFATLGFFTISPGLQITMFLPYLAVPIGGTIMLLNLIFFILSLWKRLRDKEVREEL